MFNVLLSTAAFPRMFKAMLSAETTPGSLKAILDAATDLVTWIVATLGSFLTFITQNPVILVLFLMMLVSFAVGILFRIWRSTGV